MAIQFCDDCGDTLPLSMDDLVKCDCCRKSIKSLSATLSPNGGISIFYTIYYSILDNLQMKFAHKRRHLQRIISHQNFETSSLQTPKSWQRKTSKALPNAQIWPARNVLRRSWVLLKRSWEVLMKGLQFSTSAKAVDIGKHFILLYWSQLLKYTHADSRRATRQALGAMWGEPCPPFA